jgi:hypothetical protein
VWGADGEQIVLTILELNGDGFVGAFHQKPTTSRDVSQGVREDSRAFCGGELSGCQIGRGLPGPGRLT